jgi:hypothetical protein
MSETCRVPLIAASAKPTRPNGRASAAAHSPAEELYLRATTDIQDSLTAAQITSAHAWY